MCFDVHGMRRYFDDRCIDTGTVWGCWGCWGRTVMYCGREVDLPQLWGSPEQRRDCKPTIRVRNLWLAVPSWCQTQSSRKTARKTALEQKIDHWLTPSETFWNLLRSKTKVLPLSACDLMNVTFFLVRASVAARHGKSLQSLLSWHCWCLLGFVEIRGGGDWPNKIFLIKSLGFYWAPCWNNLE